MVWCMLLGSEEKVKACKEHGAHISINYKQQNFAEEVLSFTENRGRVHLHHLYIHIHNEILWCKCCLGADVIIDFVGASYWENHTQCVAVDGRIVLLGLVY